MRRSPSAEAPGVSADHADLGPEEDLSVDPAAAALLLDWFARGDRALRRFAPAEEPVFWPEHFDLGIATGEVNYGVSPGDAGHPLPYAYLGPWTPREGEFWNASFGGRPHCPLSADIDQEGPVTRPTLHLTVGLPGVGKTTLAVRVTPRLCGSTSPSERCAAVRPTARSTPGSGDAS